MEDIHILYTNNFGISFFWKRSIGFPNKKINLAFRDTGLELTRDEFLVFRKQITASLHAAPLCSDCKNNKNCKSLLLQTPAKQISFAMNYFELEALQDLMNGTVFQLQLEKLLST